MPVIFRHSRHTMLSWFRRKKQDNNKPTESRDSIESLAAAFPNQEPSPPPSSEPAAPTDAEAAFTETVAIDPAPVQHEPEPALPAQPQASPALNQAAAHAATSWPAHGMSGLPPMTQTWRGPEPESITATGPLPGADHGHSAQALQQAAAEPPLQPQPVHAPTVVAAVPAPIAADEQDGQLAAPAAAEAQGWRDRLRGSGFARSMGGLFSRNPPLDEDLLDEIETALLTADVGVSATSALVESLRKRMKVREFADARGMFEALRAELVAMLRPVSVPLSIDVARKPFVILTVGVNGVGKTTTIGKLARRYRDEGRSVMLAAGDTFRAAAVAQLQAWGERNQVTVVAQGQNADAASVAFDALQAAQSRAVDVLIADTAGRLHTQQGLMAELGKIKRVLGKIDPDTPHEVLMVVDGTTGQNAVSQLRQFHAAAGVTGLVVTKLDGTAKGGVVFALAREFGIPIRYAGIGEHPEDLREFDPVAFVDALLPTNLTA